MISSFTDFFNEVMEAYKLQTPFVVYRKPNSEQISTFIQESNNLHVLDTYEQQGFIFAPFDAMYETVLFPFDKCVKITTDSKKNGEDQQLNVIKLRSSNDGKQQYLNLVQKGIDFIKSGKADKVVLSRKEVLSVSSFDVFTAYKQLLINYKNAFVYVWFHPKIGLWMGASPERLLEVEGNQFKTMALAGTQPFKGTIEVEWNEKERQEQQFVTDFIIAQIKKTITKLEVSKTYTVKAGNLLHLRTDILGKIVSEGDLEELLTLLHPTPAVCGLPKLISKQFILQNEGYSRKYYTGYLGELHMDNCTDLFVNLRCMEVERNKLAIYVGGGITKDSKPKNEWLETVNKTATIKKAL